MVPSVAQSHCPQSRLLTTPRQLQYQAATRLCQCRRLRQFQRPRRQLHRSLLRRSPHPQFLSRRSPSQPRRQRGEPRRLEPRRREPRAIRWLLHRWCLSSLWPRRPRWLRSQRFPMYLPRLMRVNLQLASMRRVRRELPRPAALQPRRPSRSRPRLRASVDRRPRRSWERTWPLHPRARPHPVAARRTA